METTPRRVLLLDDEPNILLALKRTLIRDGYQVFAANTPDEAFTVLKSQPVDIVISDHLMPNMTGLEFLRMVRERHPDSIRIMLTGQADMQTAIDAINHGEIYRFLTKPWDDSELKVTLHVAIEKIQEEREHRRLLTMARNAQRRAAVSS